MTDPCSVPRCRAAAVLRYHDVDLCEKHWDHLASLSLADALRWLDPVRSGDDAHDADRATLVTPLDPAGRGSVTASGHG